MKTIKSMEQLIRTVETELKHIELTDEAKKHALKFGRKFRDFDVLWKYLKALDVTLYALKFESKPGFDLARRYQEYTGIRYAYGEGKQTNRDPKFAAQRQFIWRGNRYAMSHHTGKGRRDNGVECFREYHDFDVERKKIIIGHLGSHLENYSTQHQH